LHADLAGTPAAPEDDSWVTVLDNLAYVNDAVLGSDGVLWIGTNDNLVALDTGGSPGDPTDDLWVTYTAEDGIEGGVTAIQEVDSGGLYISHGFTVTFLAHNGTPLDKTDDTYQSFSLEDVFGIPGTRVFEFVEAGDDALYLRLTSVVVRFSDGGTPFDTGDDT
jgi:hypothetical protein